MYVIYFDDYRIYQLLKGIFVIVVYRIIFTPSIVLSMSLTTVERHSHWSLHLLAHA